MSKYDHLINFFKVISQDDKLLRLLVHRSKNISDDPLSPSKPNIVGSSEHINVIKENIIRAPKFTDLPNKAICRLCVYLGHNLKNRNRMKSEKVFIQEIVIDVYVHIDEYEVIDIRSLKICDRLNDLLYDQRISGVSKVDSPETYSIPNAPEGYIGYKMIFSFGSTK